MAQQQAQAQAQAQAAPVAQQQQAQAAPVGGISYDCEYNCGYEGTFDQVAEHELYCAFRP